MSTQPTIIVKKGGFFSSLFTGVFGLLITVVICASGLGFYALHTANRTVTGLFGIGGQMMAGLPEWQKNMPPMLAQLLDERRAPDYRDDMEISAKLLTDQTVSKNGAILVTVTNQGPETVMVLALTMTLENTDGVPLVERRVYAATPITIDEDEWRGPLLPSETRKFLVRPCRYSNPPDLDDAEVTVSIADIWIWNGPSGESPDVEMQLSHALTEH